MKVWGAEEDMTTASMGDAMVTGRVRADGTLELDGAVPLEPGPVCVIVQRYRQVRSGGDTRSVLERIRRRRQSAGIRARTKEEIDAQIDALRDESESELREVERIHEQIRELKE